MLFAVAIETRSSLSHSKVNYGHYLLLDTPKTPNTPISPFIVSLVPSFLLETINILSLEVISRID
jgi:hypothetical protein